MHFFDSIFTCEIALRGQLRDAAVFLKVARTVVDVIGSPISVNKIVTTLGGEGHKTNSPTVDRFLTLMENAHLIYACHRYDTRGRGWLRTNGKHYVVDPSTMDRIALDTDHVIQVNAADFLAGGDLH
ncbi:hypothetical protein [Corynebacterium sp.]|uniref:hypothetical protein n=1 Tax=Corynebacterium sp. TaxID=1720 RepID=UPI0026E0C7DF|nr:hypothetical protein [Corynebacterium sp.]MDO5511480.1 hypothetical protein [Corynebacterium sp.]